MNLLFGLLVIFLPTQIALHFWPNWALVRGIRLDYLAPAIYLTDVIIVLLLFKLKKIPKFFFYLLLFAVLNIIFSNIWQVSLMRWFKVFEFGLLALLVYQNKRTIFEKIQKPLLVAVAYSLIIGLAQIIKGGTLGGIFYLLGERSFNISTPGIALMNVFGQQLLRPYATFPHPNVFAGFMLVSFFILIMRKERGLIEKAGAALALVGIVLSFSLGAYLVFLFLALAIFLLRQAKNIKRTLKFVFYFALYSSLVLPVVSSLVLDANYLFPKSITERLILSKAAGEAFASSPLIGVGLGTSMIESKLLQPPHNIFLVLLSDAGIIGVLLFCYLLFRVIKEAQVKGEYLLLPSLFAILLTGMFDHYWLTLQQGSLLFAIVIGGIL